MQQTLKAFNSVRLCKHSEERSSQTTGTKSLNQSCQPSMAMGKVSMALGGIKFIHGAFFLLFVASYYSTTTSLGPPDFSAHTLSAYRDHPDHHCPPITPVLLPTMPRDKGKPRRSTKNKNAYTCDNQLTASQRALIAHFGCPCKHTSCSQSTLRTSKLEHPPLQTQTSLCIPKEKTPSPTVHSPPLPLHPSAFSSRAEIPQGHNLDKGETPPSLQHAGQPSIAQPSPSLGNKTGTPSVIGMHC